MKKSAEEAPVEAQEASVEEIRLKKPVEEAPVEEVWLLVEEAWLKTTKKVKRNACLMVEYIAKAIANNPDEMLKKI